MFVSLSSPLMQLYVQWTFTHTTQHTKFSLLHSHTARSANAFTNIALSHKTLSFIRHTSLLYPTQLFFFFIQRNSPLSHRTLSLSPYPIQLTFIPQNSLLYHTKLSPLFFTTLSFIPQNSLLHPIQLSSSSQTTLSFIPHNSPLYPLYLSLIHI